MRRFLLLTIIGFVLLSFSCGRGNRIVPAKIQFQTNFNTGKAFAEKFNKPMIIYFYTEWCSWCKTMDTLTFVDSLVRSMSVENVFIKINAQAETTLALQYGITGYPTIIIAKPDGEEIDRIWGFLPPTDFYNQVQLYLQGQETLPDYLRRLEDEPDNLEYLFMIGEKYTSRAKFSDAMNYFNKILVVDSLNAEGYASEALLAMADAFSRNNEYVKAFEACSLVVNKYPFCDEFEEATSLLGVYSSKKGDDAAALAFYRQYLEKYPNGEFVEGVKNRVTDLEGKM